jgi:hypothetical protein
VSDDEIRKAGLDKLAAQFPFHYHHAPGRLLVLGGRAYCSDVVQVVVWTGLLRRTPLSEPRGVVVTFQAVPIRVDDGRQLMAYAVTPEEIDRFLEQKNLVSLKDVRL